MKKALAFLIAFALVGAFVFAQDAAPALKWSGAVYTGFWYDSANDTTQLIRYYGTPGTRVRLNGSYSNEDMGIAFRLQSNDFTAPAFTRAFGWAKLFDGLLQFNVGKLGDYTFAKGAVWAFGNFDGATGLETIVSPIAGLKIGTFMPMSIASTVPLVNVLKDTAIGVSYSAEGIGDFALVYDLDPRVNAEDAAVFSDLMFSAYISAIENLDVYIEGKVFNLGDDTAGREAFLVSEYFAYAMDALTLELYLDQDIYADVTAPNTALALTVNPAVSYTIDKYTPKLSLTYALGAAEETWTFNINPSVTYALKKGSIELGMNYDMSTTAGVADDSTYNVYALCIFNF